MNPKSPLKRKPETQKNTQSTPHSATSSASHTPIDSLQRALTDPRSATLTPDVVNLIQRHYGNEFAAQIVQRAQSKRLPTPPPDLRESDGESEGESGEAVIQRLPTRTEAEQQGGEAGFKLVGQSTWEKFLDALDAFNDAEGKNDRPAMLEHVIKLQKLTNQWLESSSRDTIFKKKRQKDERKRQFLQSLIPDLRMLYYELKIKATTVDVAKENAAEYKDENRQIIRQKLMQEKIDHSHKTIIAMLTRLRQADLTYNFNPNVLQYLIASPDFKTIWQLTYKGNSPGGQITSEYDKMLGYEKREMAERYLGYPPFTEDQRDNRPAYLGVNILNNPKGAAPSYGGFYFIFKHTVKQRATYTAYDTFKMISDKGLKDIPEKAIATSDYMEALLAHNTGVLKVLGNLVNDIEMTAAQIKLAMGFYIEAQVHGGLTVSDIEALVVNYPRDERQRQNYEQNDAEYAKAFHKKYPHIPIRYVK